MDESKLTGAQKRRTYVIWFCIALAVDLGWSVFTGTPYRPSLVGLAIMVAAVLFFIYSIVRER